ncbi:PREDICTED: uncharacterized protein LOC106297859 isoform X1 [Brassica oleracea var. oleracea]|uniref:uncharacterized protein LOC106297859 isoform X1 n=1 Tax=Brassica oleracea var. oleracea TaxID=109376 RepID=UPI0006A6F457|nr:PREDICTED: uncharacterized protein LOC106297859 isoform X1 [Brassica oleracea var. oleracea]
MRELESFKMTSLHQNLQWPPVGAPTNIRQEEPWRSQFNDPVNAVSFGFIATAILISMFIVMAIFEMLIRATTTNSHSSPGQVLSDLESRVGLNGFAFSKFGCESPKETMYLHSLLTMHPYPCPHLQTKSPTLQVPAQTPFKNVNNSRFSLFSVLFLCDCGSFIS